MCFMHGTPYTCTVALSGKHFSEVLNLINIHVCMPSDTTHIQTTDILDSLRELSGIQAYVYPHNLTFLSA